MKKLTFTFLLSITFNLVFSQSLKHQLWEFASDCNDAIVQGYEEALDRKPGNFKDYCNTCIDDTANGYLFIQGSWPTCGCSCHMAIGGYKNATGDYTLVKYQLWPCSNSFGIYSNKNVVDLMPEYFSLKAFDPSASIDTINYFYLYLEVPRKGTETKVSIHPFPLGQVGVGTKGISYNTENSEIIYPSLYDVEMDIVDHIQNEEQLELLMNNRIADLPEEVKGKIQKEIGEKRRFKNEEELISKLNYIKEVYDRYSSLKYTEITFTWNREKERFEVKDRTGKPKKQSFLEFVRSANYFSYAC
ncbi:hypothetical protein [Reichenbachiella versicolor]|uniref:hypothetical protein n=1 Tax=Reichenbachiella versicolor TaxID=1821036 RepID=UPI000D6EA479|nr:hypothetical protein [Reichenbachiella versicolor]